MAFALRSTFNPHFLRHARLIGPVVPKFSANRAQKSRRRSVGWIGHAADTEVSLPPTRGTHLRERDNLFSASRQLLTFMSSQTNVSNGSGHDDVHVNPNVRSCICAA